MGWQNVFAAVFRAGNTVVINSGGEFLYNGDPTLGNLVSSNVPFVIGTPPPPPYPFDGNGNFIFPGQTWYSGNPSGISTALNVKNGAFTWYVSTTGQGGPYSQTAQFSESASAGTTSFFWFQPGLLILNEISTFNPAIAGPNDALFADSNGRPTFWTNGNPFTAIWSLDRSQTDPTFITVPGTTITPANLTKQYTVDAVDGLIPGTMYTLKTWFQGTTALNNQSIFANLNGTTTLEVVISGNFIPGLVSGQTVFGWIELEVLIVNATTVRTSVHGVIASAPTPQTNTTSCAFASGVLSLAFTGGTIGLSTDWAASNAAQSVTTFGSRFTRRA